MVFVRRKENETLGALMRRFTRRVQLSGVLLNARKRKHYTSEPNRRMRRDSALRKIHAQKRLAWLDKLGRLNKKEK